MNTRRTTGIETTVPLGVSFDESGICILESVHARGFHMQWTRQGFWKLLIVLAGGGELELEGGHLAIRESALVLIPPGMRHRLVDSLREPLSVYIVCMAKPELVTSLIPAEKRKDYLWLQSRESARHALEIIRRMRFEEERRQTGHMQMRHALITQVLVPMIRDSVAGSGESNTKRTSRDRIRVYLAGLDSSFFLPDSIDSAAERVGMSRRRFTQLIREESGCSWVELMRRKRIHYSLQLLGNPERSVAAIAFECGFEDLSTFYRAFRKETGKKPEECRKRPT